MMKIDEARKIIDSAKYWHYNFKLPWKEVVATRAGWNERLLKRKAHFFPALLKTCGGDLRGKDVLDLGCCQGFWSFECQTAGALHAKGVDSSPDFVAQANALKTVFDMSRCSFSVFNLEESWQKIHPMDVVLLLGTLYHTSDPIYVLTKAMDRTKMHLLIDGEVASGEAPALYLWPRTPGEPTTVNSKLRTSYRSIPTLSAILMILRDGGFKSIEVLPAGPDTPEDYRLGKTVSILASRSL
jgi:tRNA (mo5U34)-methyltransferase